MADTRQDLADLRREFRGQPLRRAELDADPFVQFDRWFREASRAAVPEPNAMCLATVAADGQPSSRTVLLKFYDRSGFVFYTNYGSRKAREIEANPRVALLLFWPDLFRQVKIRGHASRCSSAESLAYFLRRPRDSQLGAWVSSQSQVISSRAVLQEKFAEMKRRFAAGEVPLPSFWGGYRVVPQDIEFWQGQESRLHDRFAYSREGDAWRIERLAP
ncbi:pyridoxamine 5'-phosphate oxidase [Gammaproteobacteria bacterium]|nr:pyridoxamine 5'-phosphate oxidase [Gammaproteobacteria bacterium]